MGTPRLVSWERLDRAGRDVVRIWIEGTLRLVGTTELWMDGVLARLRYVIHHDRAGAVRLADVDGSWGDRRIGFQLVRMPDGTWWRDGVEMPAVRGLDQLELGLLTPSTKTGTLRQLGLRVGQAARMHVAWLDPRDWHLKRVEQHLERTSSRRFELAIPDFGKRVRIETDADLIVQDYPGLFRIGQGG